MKSGAVSFRASSQSPRFHASIAARIVSTFSFDIARKVWRRILRFPPEQQFRASSKALLRQPGGFQRLGGVHVSLDADNAAVTQIMDGRRVDHELDPALGALILAVKDHHPVPGIDELLWLDPVLIPRLRALPVEGLD